MNGVDRIFCTEFGVNIFIFWLVPFSAPHVHYRISNKCGIMWIFRLMRIRTTRQRTEHTEDIPKRHIYIHMYSGSDIDRRPGGAQMRRTCKVVALSSRRSSWALRDAYRWHLKEKKVKCDPIRYDPGQKRKRDTNSICISQIGIKQQKLLLSKAVAGTISSSGPSDGIEFRLLADIYLYFPLPVSQFPCQFICCRLDIYLFFYWAGALCRHIYISLSGLFR